MARIRLENVSKHFGHVRAVDDVSLTIEEGQFFALLGPSGCGKTTTLRLIAGLEQPTAGRILIGDRDVTHLPARLRDVAMVFQDYALFPHMSVYDNIAYPLKVRRVASSIIEARTVEAARNLQIETLLQRRPGQLSGGQQQRVAVARAVVHRPKAFLFDEPLSNLDARLRVEARGFLKHLQQELGITAVYVTHDQSEALALADAIAIMQAGRVVQVGTPKEIYERPINSFVASFVGNPPMNILPCRLERDDQGPVLVGPSLRIDAELVLSGLRNPPAIGEALLLGVRPEHLRLLPSPPPADERPRFIWGELFVVEWLGHETLTTLHVDGSPIVVRSSGGEEPMTKERVWVEVDLRRLHLFRESGERVE